MKLAYKLTIPIFFILAGVVFSALFLSERALEKSLYQEEFAQMQENTERTANQLLKADYFRNPFDSASQHEFDHFISSLKNPSIARLSVWSRDWTIVKSDLLSLTGVQNREHEDLKRLFSTGKSFFILKTEDENKPIQANIGEFLDVYIPIFISGELVGGVEAHIVAAGLLRPVTKAFDQVTLMMVFGAFLIFLTILILFVALVEAPLGAMKHAMLVMSAGKFDRPVEVSSSDEIGLLARHFEFMRLKIQSLFAMLEKEKKSVEAKVVQRTRNLHEAQARLLASVNSLRIGFVLADLHNNIVLQNPAIKGILGLKEVNMGAIARHLAPEFNLDAKRKECLSRKTSVVVDGACKSQYFRLFLSPVIVGTQPIGYALLVEDITEAKLLDRTRAEFFSVASHEMRTPLTVIRGNMELIGELFADKLNPKMREMIEDTHQSSIRLIKMVNDFLEVSSLEQKQVTFNKETVDPFLIAAEAIEGLKSQAHAKKINLTIKPQPKNAKAPLVSADQKRMRQVLDALIHNAIVYTDRGDVTVSIKAEGKFVKILVQDTGIGISPKNQALLFRKFQQAGESLTTRNTAQSLGLSLYITKMLMDSMGGEVGLLKSKPGAGSTFYLAFPIMKEKRSERLRKNRT